MMSALGAKRTLLNDRFRSKADIGNIVSCLVEKG